MRKPVVGEERVFVDMVCTLCLRRLSEGSMKILTMRRLTEEPEDSRRNAISPWLATFSFPERVDYERIKHRPMNTQKVADHQDR